MGTPNKVTVEVLAEVVRRWNAHETQGEIAKALGLSRPTVVRHLRKALGVTTPDWQGGGRVAIQRARKEKERPTLQYPDNPPRLAQYFEKSPGEAARFWTKVASPNENGCRLWLASKKVDEYGMEGYGQFGVSAEVTHRVAWRLAYGPIPEGKQVNHRCDVRACVEPSHLWLGTHADNMLDMAAKGRRLGKTDWSRGEDNVRAKLTWEKVRELRRLRNEQGLTLDELATRFQISQSQASNIAAGRQWVEPETETPAPATTAPPAPASAAPAFKDEL